MSGQYFWMGRGERLVLVVVAVLLAVIAGAYYMGATPSHAEGRGASSEVASLSSSPSVLASSSSAPKPKKPSARASADSLHTSAHYVGPPEAMRQESVKKFAQLTELDLNSADSLTLIRVPGIGPAFAHRILALRKYLGGYYTVLQLQEVYGMDEDKFLALRRWFRVKTPPRTYLLDSLRADELPRHPYLLRSHRQALNRLLYRHGRITGWRMLMQTGSFTYADSVRLSPYFVELSAPSSGSSTK